MSVNSTVDNTRSSSGAGRVPVTNSATASTIASASPRNGMWSSPRNSTSRACGIAAARGAPPARGRTVAAAVQHEREGLDRREHGVDVQLAEDPDEFPVRRGGAASRSKRAHHRTKPGSASPLGPRRPGPAGPYRRGVPVEERLLLLRAPPERVIRIAYGLGQRGVQDQPLRPLRIGRGEQHRHRPPWAAPKTKALATPRVVHHRAQVVHLQLQRRRHRPPVGQAHTAHVEHDQPAERGQRRSR